MAIDWKVIHYDFATKAEAEESAVKKRALGNNTKVVKLGRPGNIHYVVHYGKPIEKKKK